MVCLNRHDCYFRWIVRKPVKGSMQWKLLEKGLLALSYLFNFFPILLVETVFVSLITFISVIAFISGRGSGVSFVSVFRTMNIVFAIPLCGRILFDFISNLIAVRKKLDSFEIKQEITLSNCSLESAVTEGCIVGTFALRKSPISDRFLYIDCIGL